MSNPPKSRAVPKDPYPNRIKSIADITTKRVDTWQALYILGTEADLRPIVAWCSALAANGYRIGESSDDGTYAVYGLVIDGNRLEVCDTHTDFIAYVQNPDARLIRELIHEWRMANNQ